MKRLSRVLMLVPLLVAMVALAGCEGPELDTRTFEVRYLQPHEVRNILEPYVFTDREGRAGLMSTSQGAVTVRETDDNLEKIGRVLEQFDVPKPTVMLSFQIIEADGAREVDPAIAEVEAELRRLFRFEGYELVAETQVVGIQGTGIRQMIGDARTTYTSDEGFFMIEGGVSEVRGTTGADPTITLDVRLSHRDMPNILSTTVTIPAGHSVVLGTAQAPGIEGALVLVVKAEIVGEGEAAREGPVEQ